MQHLKQGAEDFNGAADTRYHALAGQCIAFSKVLTASSTADPLIC